MNYYKFLKEYYNGKEPVLKLHDGGLGYKPPKFYIKGKGIEEDKQALTIYNDPRRKINEKKGDLTMLDVLTRKEDEETKQLINSLMKGLKQEEEEPTRKERSLITKQKGVEGLQQLQELMKPSKIISKRKGTEKREPKKKESKKDVLYEELTQKRKEYISPNIEDWNLVINKKENKKLKQIYEQLELGNLNNKIDEIQTYIKPEILNATNCDLFEEKFKSTDAVNLFLTNIYENYKKKNIKEMVIIHTETSYNNLTFNGETFNFKADKYFPVDIIVLTKTKTNEIKKYAIELKYYDKTKYYTGIQTERGKINKSGDIVTYKRLCELQNNLYDIYKKNTIKILNDEKIEIYKLNEELEFEDDKREIKKLKNKIKHYENNINNNEILINNEVLFNEKFNKNIYGFYVSMKFSKSGFNFQKQKTDENDYNDDYVYNHMQKFKQKQLVLNFNNDGKINNIITSSGKTVSEKYNIIEGCEIIYCISMKDCILGLNYSEEIRKEPKLINNPFYSHHIFKSSYGNYTDSVGLKLEKFKLIK